MVKSAFKENKAVTGQSDEGGFIPQTCPLLESLCICSALCLECPLSQSPTSQHLQGLLSFCSGVCLNITSSERHTLS